MNLAELVVGHPDDGRALHDGRDWISWADVRGRAGGVAAGLEAAGVGAGDRVGIAMATSPDFVTAYVGTLALGAVAVPLNPNSPAPELAAELASVRPRAVLAGGHASAVIGDAVPAGTAVLGVSPEATEALSVLSRADDEPAVLLFTSGTAGEPRAAVLSHGNLLANLRQMLALPGEIARPDDIGLAAVPLFHVFGLNVSLGLCLATGGGLVLEQRFDPAESLRLVRDLGVTSVLGAPTMYAAWVDAADAGADRNSMRSVRQAISGAAALPPDVAVAFEQRFGIPVWQGYGLTEASPAVCSALGTGRNRPGSVGRPLPGVQVRIVDDAGADALQGDPGEIWVHGANVFSGYWDDPVATAEVLTEDGWLRTGDIGILDDDGDLHVVDRRKDLVIVSGFNVFPAEVEKVVAGVPGIADAVVVGKPDPVTGEAVEVVVVADAGATVTEDDVRAACAASLSRYKCPTSVRFVESMPRGLAGKALRRALREQQPA